ncbi:MAG: hypothetical protein JNK82_33060, partial [Myxococcaceae bacterium]|nr:hypothetical protein [Myxococcaceae bacterium]
EAKAIAEARAAAQAELETLQSRAQSAEERAAKLEGDRDGLQAELAAARERQVGMEAELSATKGAATGASGELEAALAGRRQAEDLLIKMRARYSELELQLNTEVPQLREQVGELMADNQMMDAERERLAGQVERLEATRSQGADSEKELKNRIDMLQRRVNAQDAELNALRRRSGAPAAPAAGAAAPAQLGRVQLTKVPATEARPSVPDPKPTPRGHAPKGRPTLGEAPEVPTSRDQKLPSKPGARPAPVAAVTPVMTPLAKEPVTRPGGVPVTPDPTDENVELEVFELELDENGDDEELLLLEEEASDPGPGSKTPPKK